MKSDLERIMDEAKNHPETQTPRNSAIRVLKTIIYVWEKWDNEDSWPEDMVQQWVYLKIGAMLGLVSLPDDDFIVRAINIMKRAPAASMQMSEESKENALVLMRKVLDDFSESMVIDTNVEGGIKVELYDPEDLKGIPTSSQKRKRRRKKRR